MGAICMNSYVLSVDGGCPKNGTHEADTMFGSFAIYKFKKPCIVNSDLHKLLQRREPMFFVSRALLVSTKRNTNNLAEARTLQFVITWLYSRKLFKPDNKFHIVMDSKLVLSQFVGVTQVKNVHLKKIYMTIYNLLGSLDYDVDSTINLHWISGDLMKQSVIGH